MRRQKFAIGFAIILLFITTICLLSGISRVNELNYVSKLLQDLQLNGKTIQEGKHVLEERGYGLSREGTGPGQTGLEDGNYSCHIGQPKWHLVPFGLERVVIRAKVASHKIQNCRADWESDLL